MKEIQLTKGKVALVDDEDFEWLNQFSWQAQKDKETWYVVRHLETIDSKRPSVLMHREILGLGTYKENPVHVDHRNFNGLDNRKENLRVATHTQSRANRRSFRGSTSQYKGVHKLGNKWRACLQSEHKNIRIGIFKDEREAAIAYDHFARKHHGEFAHLNFPEIDREPKYDLRGISKEGRKFRAQIRHENQIIYLGAYSTAEEAARVYDKKARKLKGSSAKLNFPKEYE